MLFGRDKMTGYLQSRKLWRVVTGELTRPVRMQGEELEVFALRDEDSLLSRNHIKLIQFTPILEIYLKGLILFKRGFFQKIARLNLRQIDKRSSWRPWRSWTSIFIGIKDVQALIAHCLRSSVKQHQAKKKYGF